MEYTEEQKQRQKIGKLTWEYLLKDGYKMGDEIPIGLVDACMTDFAYNLIKNNVVLDDVINSCNKDHNCNENSTMFETKNGRVFFTNDKDSAKYYDENYKDITTGSVACSICNKASVDIIRMFDV